MRENLRVLTMGALTDSDIGQMINKALEEEVEAFQWSSLLKTGIIWGVPDNTAGVVNLVQGSKRVVGYQTSFPVTFPDYVPPENWVLVAGAQYMPMEIDKFISPTELELREPWGDVTQSNVNFNLRPQFYSVPGAAQIHYVRQIIPVLPMSRYMLSLADPARLAGTSTPSVGYAEGGYDLQGNARIEIWLRPGGIQSFAVEFRERFKPLKSDNDWPQVPMNVLEQKAAMYCYASLYASKGDQTFLNLQQAAAQMYEMQRTRAIGDDIDRVYRAAESNQGFHPGDDIIARIDGDGPPGPTWGH
jgi:hypothetical protein